MLDISIQFKIDIISYDYSGYGQSQGTYNEEAISKDIEEVGEFILKDLSIRAEQLLLMGYSLGSVPTIHLALLPQFINVKGIILISPLSGVRIMNQQSDISNIHQKVVYDIAKIIDIRSPIFLVHGLKDDVIPYKNSVELSKKINLVFKWFPKKAGHSDMFTKYRSKLYAKLKLFFEHLTSFYEKHHKSFISEEVKIKRSNIQIKENYIDNLEINDSVGNEETQWGKYEKSSINVSEYDECIDKSGKSDHFTNQHSQRFSAVRIMNDREIEIQYDLFQNIFRQGKH